MKILWNRSINDNIRFRTMDYTIIENGCDCYPWVEFFCILPRKTVTGKLIFWQKAFKRRVWVVWGTGFHMEPEVQYATAFDLLVYKNEVLRV